jgi:hypothetical protein
MTPLNARKLLVDIASRDVGKREVTPNRAPWIEKLWPLTSYPEGYSKRAPYCAAGMCYVLATFIAELKQAGELVKTLAMNGSTAERWRCKDAGAWNWMEWAEKKGVLQLTNKSEPKPGDFVVYNFHHIGMVESVEDADLIHTIEYNTNQGGSRDGDGCLKQNRRLKDVQQFIRIIV